MDSNGIDKMPKTSEIRVESNQEVSKCTDQIQDFDAPLQINKSHLEGENLREVSEINLNPSSNTGLDDSEDQRTSTSSALDNNPLYERSDLYSTPETNRQKTNLFQSSSVVEVSQSNDINFSPSPQVRRAPVHRNLFLESQEIAFSRSMTERRGSPMPALKLDRLSEREKIQNDGTVEVDLTKDSPVASELLEFHPDYPVDRIPSTVDYITTDYNKSIPKLKIAVLVVGTRGDVQPFLAVARRLQEYGHRVRLATHSNFRGFVKSAGVEFYPLGGDPRVLAGCKSMHRTGSITGEPFRAQAIIANPPAYGHAHVAEALGVPLHIFFTMPWTPTYAFPHPLARVPQSAGYWLSYILVDLLIWWGIRGHINDFRKNKLKLAPIAYFSTYHGSISHLPTGYMWSPHVVPMPSDWGPLVDVVGYCFLNLGSKYQPPEEFVQWIQKGSQPIYIGFGSMPLEDSHKTTDIILEALKNTGQRGIIDRGWGELGTHSDIPDNVFHLVDCPHDWLFPQCSAVVHHGGAGTTATGLKAGCPTTIVPFFGDQFFWGERIYQKGLGPAPIPISQLSVESLSEAIKFMLQPEVCKISAMEIAVCIQNEDGVGAAVDAFHRHLPPELRYQHHHLQRKMMVQILCNGFSFRLGDCVLCLVVLSFALNSIIIFYCT
ncbi:hypothetical protein DH2020_047474 [Rehmannia glutinosa]|uniref:Sterol 3-beta-glucosyltransferase n=1 Tax=Rehmannia glutinosa TaxID=99300 RepID=A0ABR0U8E9_REHGL